MPRKNKLILFAMCLGTFVVMLDTTIMNIALPSIQKELSISLADLSWALNSYTILFAALTIPLGKLANIFGKKNFYISALILFAIGSLISGLSNTLIFLTAGRILQSIGAAAIFPLSMDMAISTQEANSRSRATLIVGITQGSASAFGPSIGGVIIQLLNWRWIFLINIPIIFIALYLVILYLPTEESLSVQAKIDWLGTVWMIVALFSLTLGLIEFRNSTFNNHLLILILISITSLLLFIMREQKTEDSIIDFKLFKSPNFNLATLGTILGQLLLVGFMVVMPTFFETIYHKTSFEAALLISPTTFMIFLLSPLAGKLMKKVRPRILLALGFLMIGAGYFGLSMIQPSLNYTFYIICSIFIGAGYGMIVGPISILSTRDFTGSNLTISQGVIGVLRQLGTVLATTIFISSLTHNLSLARGLKTFVSSFTSLYLYTAPIAGILAIIFLLAPTKKNSKGK